MKVYALTYKIGISSGAEVLIGAYSAREKAEEVKQKDMKRKANMEWHYSIIPIEIDKAINITIRVW